MRAEGEISRVPRRPDAYARGCNRGRWRACRRRTRRPVLCARGLEPRASGSRRPGDRSADTACRRHGRGPREADAVSNCGVSDSGGRRRRRGRRLAVPEEQRGREREAGIRTAQESPHRPQAELRDASAAEAPPDVVIHGTAYQVNVMVGDRACRAVSRRPARPLERSFERRAVSGCHCESWPSAVFALVGSAAADSATPGRTITTARVDR